MQPPPSPTPLAAPLLRFAFPKLARPAILEHGRDAQARALENYLAPVLAYCDRQEADDNLSEADFQHVYALRQAINALLAYDDTTEQLLAAYRAALETGQQFAARLVPSLEEALGLPPVPAPEGDRASDPVYRLGWCRGYRRAQAQVEQLSSLYAQHALLVPPAGYQPSPLVAHLQRHLDSPDCHAYAALPLTQRQTLNSLTPADWHHLITNGTEPGQTAA